MIAFTPTRVQINGLDIIPLEFDLVLDAESNEGVRVLQQWLFLSKPAYFFGSCNGITTDTTLLALKNFKLANSLAIDNNRVDQAVWNALEENIVVAYGTNPELKKSTPISQIAHPATSAKALRVVGIHAEPNEEEIKKGWMLYQAMSRNIPQFKYRSYNGTITDLFPELLDGKIHFSKSVWEKCTKFWTQFYGAPWLGIVCDTNTSMPIDNSFWCSKSLCQFLRKLGQNYIEILFSRGISLDEIQNNPLIIKYTGLRLGGMIDDRNDFSQTGMSAALKLTNFHQLHISHISEALKIADPAFSLRLHHPSKNKEGNLHYTRQQLKTPVLEIGIKMEKLFYNPAAIGKDMLADIKLNNFPVERIAEGIADHAAFISSEEYAKILEIFKHIDFSKQLEFVAALRKYGGLGPMLQRFFAEDRSFIQGLLSIDIRNFAFGDAMEQKASEIIAYILDFERKYIQLISSQDNMKDFLVEIGKAAGKEAVTEIIKSEMANE